MAPKKGKAKAKPKAKAKSKAEDAAEAPSAEVTKDTIEFFFFGRSDLTKKLEKVGPFECDELEKHCRVSAKCYPTRVPALYTMTKEKFKSGFLLLLLVFRQTKSQLLMINNLVPIPIK